MFISGFVVAFVVTSARGFSILCFRSLCNIVLNMLSAYMYMIIFYQLCCHILSVSISKFVYLSFSLSVSRSVSAPAKPHNFVLGSKK